MTLYDRGHEHLPQGEGRKKEYKLQFYTLKSSPRDPFLQFYTYPLLCSRWHYSRKWAYILIGIFLTNIRGQAFVWRLNGFHLNISTSLLSRSSFTIRMLTFTIELCHAWQPSHTIVFLWTLNFFRKCCEKSNWQKANY